MRDKRLETAFWCVASLCWPAVASTQYIPGRSVTDATLAAMSRVSGAQVSDPSERLFAALAKLEHYPDLQFATTKASGALIRVYGLRVDGSAFSIRAVSDPVALDYRVTGNVLFEYSPAYCIIRGTITGGAIDSARIISENSPATLAVELDLPGAKSIERTAAYFEALIELARLGQLGPITEEEIAAVNHFRALFLIDPAANLPRAMARPLSILDSIDGLRVIAASLRGKGESGKIAADEIVVLPALFEFDKVFKDPAATALFEEGRRLQFSLLRACKVHLNDRVRFYRPSINEPALGLAIIRRIRELQDEGRIRPDLASIDLVNNQETPVGIEEAGLSVTFNVLTATLEDVDRFLTGPGTGTPRPPLESLLSQGEQDDFKASALESFARIDQFRSAIEPYESSLGELQAAVDAEALEKSLTAEYEKHEAKAEGWVKKFLH